MDLIATIGPSSWTRDVLEAFLRLGVKCVRFPFSKLQPAEHVDRCRMLRGIARELGIPVLTMADLPGGRPRLHADGPVHVETSRQYRIAVDRTSRSGKDFWLEPGLPGGAVEPGNEVLIGDGQNRFVVTAVSTDHLTGTFATAGTLEWQRVFSPIGIDLQLTAFTDRDKECAAFAHAGGFDWLALSFISSSEDVIAARSWLRESLEWTPYLVAKIETRAAVNNVDAIAGAADAVMLARGDLALQIGFDALWPAQKSVIDACARAGRYCIAATGFLESLARHHTPTRAECMDFCSTLAMGAPAILFSNETSIGGNPVLAVETALQLERSWKASCAQIPQAHLPF